MELARGWVGMTFGVGALLATARAAAAEPDTAVGRLGEQAWPAEDAGGVSGQGSAAGEVDSAARAAEPEAPEPLPPPLHVDYASYGLAISTDLLIDAGASCSGSDEGVPCILGSGGGLVLRGGYRPAGPWYIGGAYQFSKTDSSNLYRLPILQQLRGEMRYMLDMGYRISPYATWGLGGLIYGNEWGAETGGAALLAGIGAEMQLSRVAVMGLSLVYEPMLIAAWTDTADIERETGVAHYLRIELQLEVRSEIGRR